MKKNNVKKGIFTALLLASPFVTAGTQYPAADFQPKVLFQDTEYQHQGSESSSSKASASFGEKAKADSNYPAATFQPEVVYQDTEYKHSSGTETSKSIPLAMWEEKVEEVAAAESEESTMNPLFAIVVLGVAVFLFSKKSKGTANKSRRATKSNRSASVGARSSEGLSGVAKYLESKSPTLSGVAKYLEANQSAKSGVAKYVAKRVVAAKQAAAKKTTGVEKYMRNKG